MSDDELYYQALDLSFFLFVESVHATLSEDDGKTERVARVVRKHERRLRRRAEKAGRKVIERVID